MNVHLSIAGVVVEVAGCPDQLAGMYEDYVVAGCEPDVRVSVGSARRGWSVLQRTDMSLAVSPDRREARVIPLAGDCAIDRALRMMLADRLPSRGGLVLHASAALIGRRVVAFVGETRAGKSTVARLLGVDRLIADDTLAVDSHGVAWATPFHNWGEPIPKPRRGLLGRIFVLDKGSVDEVLPVRNPLAALARHAMTGPPGYSTSAYLEAVTALARVPVAMLRRTLHGDLEELLASDWVATDHVPLSLPLAAAGSPFLARGLSVGEGLQRE